MRRRRSNNEDNDELEDMNDKGFKKVPIEKSKKHSIEIYNVYTPLGLSKTRLIKKLYKVVLYLIVIIIVFLLFRILRVTSIFNQNSEHTQNNYNYNDSNYRDPDEDEFNNSTDENENIYLLQKKEKIDFKSFTSPQLRNPKKIKIIEKLQISLDLEYDKFVHLKMTDSKEKRWEMPEKEILDKGYLKDRNNNIVGMSKYSRVIDSQFFYLELMSNTNEIEDDVDPEMDDPDNRYNGVMNDTLEEFNFKLFTQDGEEFYSFSSSKNFLFSDKYINFESKLTSDKIYGFGEKTHDFKLNDGTYTIWNYDCGSKKYDDGKGGMNEYSHQPIGLHRTKFSNIWLGFVFLNSNAQDVIIHSDKNNTYLTHKTIGGIIDYYIIVEDSPEKVVKSIQTLLGIPPLPPFWSFGYHQSRYGYKSFDDFKNVYEKYKSLEIPIDSMFLDIDSFKDNEMFTINDKFKDIIPYVENTIHKDGGKLVPITGLGYSSEDVNNSYIKLGEELDIFIKSNYTKKNLIGKVWDKKTVFPDFLNPNISIFWNKGLEDYHNLINYDGIWINMNEPSNILENSKCIGEIAEESECTKDKNKYNIDELPYIPGYKNNIKDNLSYRSISENALVYGINGSNTIYDTKPLISYYQTMHTYNYFNDSLKKRPFILSRSKKFYFWNF